MNLALLTWTMVLAPLIGGTLVGFWGNRLGRVSAQMISNLGVALSFSIALVLSWQLFMADHLPWHLHGFIWRVGDYAQFSVGLWVDKLTIVMMTVVTFVSCLVHLYSIAYLHDDPGYRRFFSYISLFTFAMLMLVGADNFLQLFFGWEAVGLMSYLLIGFWFEQPAASIGSFKAFLVNRVGDFGFLLGIALLFKEIGSLDYATIIDAVPTLRAASINLLGTTYPSLTVICLLLFVGAMGKSAQIPLHVWLPESMAGPTPVSALIHAATMVTAGIYMVTRLSPLFEYAPGARSFILAIGATTALFMGLVAIVQTDIKRVIAFSTLSQLGYMVAGLGVSAYTASIFHLSTHACFKALLFLAAGSVILSLHHEQNIRKMGGLWRHLPITYGCFLMGALALVAIPPFSGFYSKDAIIEAVYNAAYYSESNIATYAFYSLLAAALVTALYTFRLLFLVFHGTPAKALQPTTQLRESPILITLPLIVLAIPAAILGKLLISSVHAGSWLGISVLADYQNISPLLADLLKPPPLGHLPTLLSLTGIGIAWLSYIQWPRFPDHLAQHTNGIYQLLVQQYGFDRFNQRVFVQGIQRLAKQCARWDKEWVDQQLVQGAARMSYWVATHLRRLQSGYLYHYLLIMIIALLNLLVSAIYRA